VLHIQEEVIPIRKDLKESLETLEVLSKLRDFIETNQTLLLYFLLLQPFL